MAFHDTAQILIRHWRRVAERVEQDGIGCLGPNTGESEQALCGEAAWVLRPSLRANRRTPHPALRRML